MTWANDVGGAHGFGAVPRAAPPGTRDAWARRMWAVNQLLIQRGVYTFDHYRHAIERMAPAAYLAASGDRRRLAAVETLVRERVGDRAVPATGHSTGHSPVVPDGVTGGGAPRFAVGDAVAVRTDDPATHTRTPGYVRGRRGTVERVRGRAVPPEDRVRDVADARPQPVYAVRFDARELWGAQGRAGDDVRLDLWEHHLEPAR